jgi:hypothetical protein
MCWSSQQRLGPPLGRAFCRRHKAFHTKGVLVRSVAHPLLLFLEYPVSLYLESRIRLFIATCAWQLATEARSPAFSAAFESNQLPVSGCLFVDLDCQYKCIDK